MSDKLFVRRRILAFLMVFLLVFSAIILLPAFSVDAETEEEYAVASSGEISNEVALASGLSAIPSNVNSKCVELTDSDEFEHKGTKYSIKDYPNIYKNMYTAAGREPYKNLLGVVSIANSDYDDPINKIVPVELMKQIGVYEYFGKEYGFFIKTFKSESLDDDTIHSIVFVFDIKYSMKRGQDGNPDGCVAVNIEPVFQYAYVYLDSNDKSFRMYDYETPTHSCHVNYSISSNVIIPHPKNNGTSWSYDYWDIFYLKDISVGMSLFNEQALNYQKDRYLWDEVDGAFFTMTDSEYMGHVLKERKLTTDDKLDIASFVASYVFDMIGLGANLIVPGSGTLIEMIDLTNLTIGWTGDIYKLDKIQTGEQLGFKEKNVTFTSLYANKTEQKKHYNGLVKSMLVANNSDNNNSIWYGQGDHYRAIFGINAEIASGKQFPNTRAFVECALKIVDKNGNVYGAQNAVNKTVDNETYQESIDFAVNEDIYLLPNGYNCFSFVPYYSGKYIFNFDFNNSVKIEVDGEEINGNSVDIVKDYTPNAPPVKIKIKNNGDAVKGKLLIDVSSINETTDLIYDKDIILKVNVKNSGFYKISTNNFDRNDSNIIFINRCTVDNDRFGIRESLYNKSQTATYLDNNTYLIIKKTVNNDVKMSFNYMNVDEIGEDQQLNYELTGNTPTYFKFVTDDNINYKLLYSLGLISAMIYDINGKIVEVPTQGVDENYNNFIFNSGTYGEVYIKFFYDKNDDVNFDCIIYEADSKIRWFVDGIEVPNRVLEVERGKSVTISAKINDTEVYGVNTSSKYDNIVYDNNILSIKNNAPFGNLIRCIFNLWNDSTIPLVIIPVFERKIELSLSNNWNLHYSGGTMIKSFDYYVEVSDRTNSMKSSTMKISNIDYDLLLSKSVGLLSIITNMIYKDYPVGGWINNRLDIFVKVNSITAVALDGYKEVDIIYDSASYDWIYFYFFKNGVGTQNNPYQISTTREFNSLKLLHEDFIEGTYFKQTANLAFITVLPDTSNMSFRGMYDGGGYTISYSYVFPSANFKSYIGGMFLENYGAISNLTVNATINNLSVSNKYDLYGLGGIVGTNYGTISKVNANVSISSCFYLTGGITSLNDGTIENCKVTGKIDLKCENDIFHGGMIAGSTFGKISSCSSAGSTISYVGAESKSRTLEPRIGTTVGVWAGGTLIPIGYGTVNKGTLKTVTWWEGLKKKSHNQAAYVGNIYGQKTF
ncbi:MAG: hypothetical protein OSJ67_03820 [Clostridia bacterium]|nr:hypothetical protein [Clostridia bacterium]